MLVVLVNKQSEETLKLLLSFQMMKKSSFIMDYSRVSINWGVCNNPEEGGGSRNFFKN